MKKIILYSVILLSGCTAVPVKSNFPAVPAELMVECKSLETIGKTTVKLSELMSTVVKNYEKFHECDALNDAWRNWYIQQKKIFDSVNK